MKFEFADLVRDASTGETSLVWLSSGGVEETQSGQSYSYGAPEDPNYCPPRTISGCGSIAHAPWNADENPLGSLDLSFDDLGYYSAIFWDPLYRYPLTSTPQCGAGGLDDIMKSLAVQVEEFAPQATLQQGQSTDYGQGAEPQPSDTFATFTTSSSFKADVPGG